MKTNKHNFSSVCSLHMNEAKSHPQITVECISVWSAVSCNEYTSHENVLKTFTIKSDDSGFCVWNYCVQFSGLALTFQFLSTNFILVFNLVFSLQCRETLLIFSHFSCRHKQCCSLPFIFPLSAFGLWLSLFICFLYPDACKSHDASCCLQCLQLKSVEKNVDTKSKWMQQTMKQFWNTILKRQKITKIEMIKRVDNIIQPYIC